jgi:low affinity Fe/Cu permease
VRPTKSKSWFTRFTKWTARASGKSVTFIAAVLIIVAWAEELEEEELDRIREGYQKIAERARGELRKR